MTRTLPEISWVEANRAVLVAEFARLRRELGADDNPLAPAPHEARQLLDDAPAAIDQLTELFTLSNFERDLLLLCAGVEMDSALAEQCAKSSGHTSIYPVTFGLSMNVLPEPHWSALTPARPLRRFRLIEMEGNRGLSTTPLRVDERILHYLAGINLLDSRLYGLVHAPEEPVSLPTSHQEIVERTTSLLTSDLAEAPVLHLCGNDSQGQEDIAATTSRDFDHRLLVLRVEDLPAPGADLDRLVSLLEREVLLLPAAICLKSSSGEFSLSARRIAERLPGPLFLSSRDTLSLDRPLLRFDVNKPCPTEQRQLWQEALGSVTQELNTIVDQIAEQFSLSTRTIFTTSALVQKDDSLQPQKLWDACRAVSRPRLESLAQRISPSATWDDLVLPAVQLQTLHHMVSQVRHRMEVYENWGFSTHGRRGLGVSALFTGESGTGKTLAAEVLATELRLDLYRIDLSSVVSKYIGETEKNLKQVFDAAEDGGVLLLFDEADALFGKRAEVKDSHDRYANIEVGYLLQRMEAYQGLAVLTTNLKSSLDRAFQRRLRFIINFPFPDATQREAIWRRIFPATTPTEGLDFPRLAQLNVAGGNIRNIALTAAFLAAESNSPIRMTHLLDATRIEMQKVERPLSPAETRGWE